MAKEDGAKKINQLGGIEPPSSQLISIRPEEAPVQKAGYSAN